MFVWIQSHVTLPRMLLTDIKATAEKKKETNFRVRDRALARNTEQFTSLLQYLSLPSWCINEYWQIWFWRSSLRWASNPSRTGWGGVEIPSSRFMLLKQEVSSRVMSHLTCAQTLPFTLVCCLSALMLKWSALIFYPYVSFLQNLTTSKSSPSCFVSLTLGWMKLTPAEKI